MKSNQILTRYVSAKERSISGTSGVAASSAAGRRARVEPLDSFETDVPITPEDREAQWRIRDGATMTSKQYLDWCSWITRDAVVLRRDLPKRPFELPNAATIEAMQELEEGKGERLGSAEELFEDLGI